MFGAWIAEQELMHEAGGLAMEIKQSAAFFAIAFGIGIIDVLDDGNIGLGGESANGVHKREPFVFHHKGKRIAAFATAEAFERLALRIDVKRRRFFVVKRAICLKGGASTLDGDIGADEVHDVGGLKNFDPSFLGNLCQIDAS